MSKWTNVRKFDFAKGEYTNSYYKLSDFDYFVDSEFGSDTNDGLTPQTAFKTLAKLATLGSEYYKDGIRVACSCCDMNGFAPLLNVNIVGVSGHNGRFLTNMKPFSNTYDNNLVQKMSKFENVEFTECLLSVSSGGYRFDSIAINNCIIGVFGKYQGGRTYCGVVAYNSIIVSASYGGEAFAGIYGYNCSILNQSNNGIRLLGGKSVHLRFNTNYNGSTNSLINTDSRYFTDNTETTPADLYIDSANGNYGIVPTFSTPIWDKQTQKYITANPLYHTGADGANIGAGVETLALTALDDSLKSTDNGGDATYTNMENDPNGSSIFRIDDSIDGTLVSGLQDLGRVMNGVKIDAIATYDTNGGLITKRLQQSTPSIEQTTDFGIQFGETQQECMDMTPILCEYGKVVTYSKSGNIMYGNSDLNFQPNKKKVAKFRYFIISIRAKTIS